MQAHADFIIVGGDGRKATQCGNGLIYGAWCIHARTGRMRICFNCSGRIREASLRRGIWILDLGAPSVCAWSGGQVPGLATEPLLIDTGEPHAVSLEEDLSGRLVDFEILGAEVCSRYDPEGVNWTLIWPRSDHIFIRTFERGVRRSTTSCGTGAAAAFHAMRCHGRPPGDSLSVRSHGGVHIVSGRSESVLIGAAPSHFSSSTLGTLLAQWIY
jgi:diaminopimelate epimerase